MASGRLLRLSLLTRFSSSNTPQSLGPPRHQSSVRAPSLDDPHRGVEIGLTSDGTTVVCHHPAADVPYELTQPIERPDPLRNEAESHAQVLKAQLSTGAASGDRGPSIEELSKMFYTTKHRWYPHGQFHMRRRKKDPPKDR